MISENYMYLFMFLDGYCLSENCTTSINSNEIDPASVELLNDTKPDSSPCARFKSHPKEKEKRKSNL